MILELLLPLLHAGERPKCQTVHVVSIPFCFDREHRNVIGICCHTYDVVERYRNRLVHEHIHLGLKIITFHLN